MPEQTDAELIEAVLAGSALAFERLIERYQDRLARLLGRYTRDRDEVEDLTQEVFVKVYRKLHTFNQESALYTWLYRIAINTANDHVSRHKRRRLALVEDADGIDVPRETGSDRATQPLIDEEMRAVTRAVLDGLSEKYRTILILREFEDLSYTEMAEVLGCSIGTVESRLFRARQRFKDALVRGYPDFVPGRTDGPVRRVRKRRPDSVRGGGS